MFLEMHPNAVHAHTYATTTYGRQIDGHNESYRIVIIRGRWDRDSSRDSSEAMQGSAMFDAWSASGECEGWMRRAGSFYFDHSPRIGRV